MLSTGAALLALAAALAPLLVALHRRRSVDAGDQDPRPAVVAEAAPAHLGVLVDGRVRPRQVAATLVDLAVRGHLLVEVVVEDAVTGPARAGDSLEMPTDWVLVPTGADRGALRSFERRLLDLVLPGEEPLLLSALPLSTVTAIGGVRRAVLRDVVELGWFHADPSRVRRAWGGYGAALLTTGAVVALLAAGTSLGWAGAGAGTAGSVVLLLAGRVPARTSRGVRSRAEARAFGEDLGRWGASAVPPSEVRRDGDHHLGRAVALGRAEEWAAALRRAQAPATGGWWPSRAGQPAWAWFPSFATGCANVTATGSLGVSASGGGVSTGAGAGGLTGGW